MLLWRYSNVLSKRVYISWVFTECNMTHTHTQNFGYFSPWVQRETNANTFCKKTTDLWRSKRKCLTWRTETKLKEKKRKEAKRNFFLFTRSRSKEARKKKLNKKYKSRTNPTNFHVFQKTGLGRHFATINNSGNRQP